MSRARPLRPRREHWQGKSDGAQNLAERRRQGAPTASSNTRLARVRSLHSTQALCARPGKRRSEVNIAKFIQVIIKYPQTYNCGSHCNDVRLWQGVQELDGLRRRQHLSQARIFTGLLRRGRTPAASPSRPSSRMRRVTPLASAAGAPAESALDGPEVAMSRLHSGPSEDNAAARRLARRPRAAPAPGALHGAARALQAARPTFGWGPS